MYCNPLHTCKTYIVFVLPRHLFSSQYERDVDEFLRWTQSGRGGNGRERDPRDRYPSSRRWCDVIKTSKHSLLISSTTSSFFSLEASKTFKSIRVVIFYFLNPVQITVTGSALADSSQPTNPASISVLWFCQTTSFFLAVRAFSDSSMRSQLHLFLWSKSCIALV